MTPGRVRTTGLMWAQFTTLMTARIAVHRSCRSGTLHPANIP